MKILRNIAIVASIVFVLSIGAGFAFAAAGFKDGYTGIVDLLNGNDCIGIIHDDKSLTADTNGMTDLVIKAGAAKVSLVREDRTDVKVDYTSQIAGVGNNPITVERSGDTVKIESTVKNIHNLTFFKGMYMTVYIPQNYNGSLSLDVGAGALEMKDKHQYSTVSINIGAGSISIDELQAQSLKADVSVGKFHINKVNVPVLTLDVSAGTADISGAIGKTDLSVGTGNADIKYDRLTGDITATVNMGKASIYLPSDAAATVNLSANMGTVSQDFGSRFSGKSDKNYINGTLNGGGNTISGKVEMGTISIENE